MVTPNLLSDIKINPVDNSFPEDSVLYKRGLEILEKGDKIFNQVLHPYMGLTLRDFLYELELAWLAISSRQKADAAESDYYKPSLYTAAIRFSRRLNKNIFNPAGWWDIGDADKLEVEKTMKKKAVLDYYLKKDMAVSALKEGITYGVRMGTAVIKVTPCMDYMKFFDKQKLPNGELAEIEVEVKKKLISYPIIDLLDLYITDPYEQDLNKQDYGELWETSKEFLQEMEKKGIFQNTESLRSDYKQPFNLTDHLQYLRRNLLAFDDSGSTKTGKIVVADLYMKLNGEKWLVSIAGNTVIRKYRIKEIYGTDQCPHVVWRYEKRQGEFYGWGMLHRLLKTQWAQNTVFNLGFDGTLKKLNGNFFAASKVKADLERQMKGGLKSGQIIGVNISAAQNLQQVVWQVPYPDVTNLHITEATYLDNVIEETSGSTKILRGLPTGTQLDRTASGYQEAHLEASVDIVDIVNSIQDDYLNPILTKTYVLIHKIMPRTASIPVRRFYVKDEKGNIVMDQATGQPLVEQDTASVLDLYGLPEIIIYGGSLFIENQQEIKDLMEILSLLSNNPEFVKTVSHEAIIKRILELKNTRIQDVTREKSPDILLNEILQKVPLDTLKQIIDDLSKQQIEAQRSKELTDQNQSKRNFITQRQLDTQFNQETGKQDQDLAEEEMLQNMRF